MYRGRFGQAITDPRAIEARRVLTQLRRLETVNHKAGREFPHVTVGELATAAKITVGQVVAWVREYDAWRLGLIEVGDNQAMWGVFEDGE